MAELQRGWPLLDLGLRIKATVDTAACTFRNRGKSSRMRRSIILDIKAVSSSRRILGIYFNYGLSLCRTKNFLMTYFFM